MPDIHQTIEQLTKLGSDEILKQSTEKLRQVIEYLKSDLTDTESKFSASELKFIYIVKTTLSNKPSGLKKLFPFLISDIEKGNLQSLREIDILYTEKKKAIDKIYESDISIVNEFLQYSASCVKSGEIYYLESSYKDYEWTKKGFPKKMFNYLAHKIRTNPNSLTTHYLEEMKAHFSLIGLSDDDESKVRLANHYFAKTDDPFSLNIPSKYDEVRAEIKMAIPVMSLNEKLFSRIADDVIAKYGN